MASRRQNVRSTLRDRSKPIRGSAVALRTISLDSFKEPDECMVRYLKYKCTELVRSIVEMNTDPKFVYERIAKFFSLEHLMFNLYQIHKHYVRLHGKKLTSKSLNRYGIEYTTYKNHVSGDYTSKLARKAHKYCPIETGFFLYILMKNVINNCGFYQGKILKVSPAPSTHIFTTFIPLNSSNNHF